MIEEITTLTSYNGGRVWSVDWYVMCLNKGTQNRIFWHQQERTRQSHCGNKIITNNGTKQYKTYLIVVIYNH